MLILNITFSINRFFPEGRVLMLTSTDEAQSCVNSLKNRTPRNPSVLIGHYRLLHDNCVVLMLKKQEVKGISTQRKKKRELMHDSGEQTFHIVNVNLCYIKIIDILIIEQLLKLYLWIFIGIWDSRSPQTVKFAIEMAKLYYIYEI